MFFNSLDKKTVKELRKNRCLTAKELAEKLKLDTVQVLKVDGIRLKDVPEPLRSMLIPVLSGDETDKIPWL